MSDEKIPGNKKECGLCKTKLICREVTSEYQGKKETKPQWQNEEDGKPHFYFSGKDEKGKPKFKCSPPKDAAAPKPAETKPKVTTNEDMKVCAESPFTEAELIIRWAAGRAYKLTYEDYENVNDLSLETKRALGQKEGMLTKLFTDTTLDLMKQAGIKVSYDKK